MPVCVVVGSSPTTGMDSEMWFEFAMRGKASRGCLGEELNAGSEELEGSEFDDGFESERCGSMEGFGIDGDFLGDELEEDRRIAERRARRRRTKGRDDSVEEVYEGVIERSKREGLGVLGEGVVN